MADGDLDAAVQDSAQRSRAALDPPAQASLTIAWFYRWYQTSVIRAN